MDRRSLLASLLAAPLALARGTRPENRGISPDADAFVLALGSAGTAVARRLAEAGLRARIAVWRRPDVLPFVAPGVEEVVWDPPLRGPRRELILRKAAGDVVTSLSPNPSTFVLVAALGGRFGASLAGPILEHATVELEPDGAVHVVASLPRTFEGPSARERAERGLWVVRQSGADVVVLDPERALPGFGPDTYVPMLAEADRLMASAVVRLLAGVRVGDPDADGLRFIAA